MRPIEFRTWDGETMRQLDKMYVGAGQIGFSDDYYVDLNDNDHEDVVLMQFTGLLDKNGTKIFEGDYAISDHKLYGEYEQGVVEFTHTGQYVLAQGSFKTSIHDLVFNDWKLEVIGNIYQSPELLK